MARRARRHDSFDVIPQLAGLVLLLLLLVPGGLHFLPSASVLVLVIAALAVLVVFGFAFYRLSARSRAYGLKCASELLAPQKAQVEAPKPQPTTTPELLERLSAIDWYQFEKVVAFAYRKTGFQVERRGGANPDGGIDILLIGPAGERTAIQCKQWKTWNVGVKAIREFVGALKDAQVPKGTFITLAGYTREARQLAERNGIELLNEAGFVQLLESTDARIDPEVLELLHDTKKFCPKCENEMILRKAVKGSQPGRQFWGCSAYPRCRFTMPYI